MILREVRVDVRSRGSYPCHVAYRVTLEDGSCVTACSQYWLASFRWVVWLPRRPNWQGEPTICPHSERRRTGVRSNTDIILLCSWLHFLGSLSQLYVRVLDTVGGGVAACSVIFVQSFVKIGQIVENLKWGTDRIMRLKIYFFPVEVQVCWKWTFTLCVLFCAVVLIVATRYGLDGPGIEPRWGPHFRHPSKPVLGPTSLLCSGYQIPFLGVKRPGRGRNHPPTSSTEVEERVELYIYSLSGSSWLVLGLTLLYLIVHSKIWNVLRILPLLCVKAMPWNFRRFYAYDSKRNYQPF